MINVALLLLLGAQDPVCWWKLDGDVNDSGPSKLPTRPIGRVEFIDSPVAGKAAVFNGVDTCVQVDPPAALGAGERNFALSAWIVVLDRRPATLIARKGWSLSWTEGGGLAFKSDHGSFATRAGVCPPGQWTHVLVNVRRGTNEKFCLLYVNGEPLGMGDVREGTLDLPGAPLLIGKGDDGRFFSGLIDDVRLYPRALDTPESRAVTAEGMPWLLPKPHATKSFPGKFEVFPNDVIAFVGGENARVGLDQGYLETLLSLRTVGKTVRFRNMAWEGDTVYEQPRPLNFGSWEDQFRRSGTSVIFAQFGQVEALEGKRGLDRFTAAYGDLLKQFETTTKRIVLISPSPFGRAGPRQPDLAARNEDLRLYVDAIRKLAAERGCLFVDLTGPPMAEEGLTRDGLHLTSAGHWIAARETARQLEIAGLSDLDAPDAKGAFPREAYEKIRGSIRAKNQLWNDSWRPTNWAFLNGDRMEQPSSRDHVDRRLRWFPVEIQRFPAMVRREEEKIEVLLQAAEKK